jgi:putative membrane protein insertion efficiency factor
MIKKLILKIIRFYQIFISPGLGAHCRFYPSCSKYSYLSIKKYGAVMGLWRGVKRILRCHPWNSGGIDLP